MAAFLLGVRVTERVAGGGVGVGGYLPTHVCCQLPQLCCWEREQSLRYSPSVALSGPTAPELGPPEAQVPEADLF